MQKCKICSNNFKYKIILKSLWKNDSQITCESCGTQYYVNFSTRFYAILILLPLIIRFFNSDVFMFTNTFSSFICYLFWPAVVILAFPFFAKYHTKTK